jgi:dTDP-4-amino-4,6-dideoxygalactose transaminase
MEEYTALLEGIWSRKWVTNHGPLVQQLEGALQDYLQSPPLLYVGNGTLALQLAIKGLKLEGEIITTPYSYIASTSSILWENNRPVFADIDPFTCNIDPESIREKITRRTKAILAVHLYGLPCAVEAIEALAQEYGLYVIYDAAHCFGVTYKDKSLFEYGDISTTSFHATKIFHTIEGGALFTRNAETMDYLRALRQFGFNDGGSIEHVGINAKGTEFHAAMGLVLLKHMAGVLPKRKLQWLYYAQQLKETGLQLLTVPKDVQYNYAYFPVVFSSPEQTALAYDRLLGKGILAKRYFYPALHQLPFTGKASCPVAERVSACALCLPLFHRLQLDEQDHIIETIKSVLVCKQTIVP